MITIIIMRIFIICILGSRYMKTIYFSVHFLILLITFKIKRTFLTFLFCSLSFESVSNILIGKNAVYIQHKV